MIKTFLLEENFLNEYLGYQEKFENSYTEHTGEMEKKFDLMFSQDGQEQTETPYEIIDGNANIVIEGVIKNGGQSFMEWLFDVKVTNYGQIIKEILHAENNPAVENIFIHINSPGGSIDGLDQTGQVIAAATKKTTAFVHSMAASAAYWIASQAKEIIALSPASQVGSIGVVTTLIDRKESDKKNGIKRITMTSSKSPNKRPDIDSPEGQKVVQEELDQLYSVFVRRVAEGRKTTVEDVNSNYGKGSVMTAEIAIKAGMVDKVQDKLSLESENKINSTNTSDTYFSKTISEVEKMEIKSKADLIAAFPGFCSEIKSEGFEAGKKAGIDLEKTRIASHATFADVAPASVLKNITDGKEFDTVCSAEYQKEMMTKKLSTMRTDENADGLDIEGNGEKPDAISGILSRIIADHGGE